MIFREVATSFERRSHAIWVLLFFVFLSSGCTVLYAENANFRTEISSWIIPAHKGFANQVTVTVIDVDTKKPLPRVQIGAMVQKPGSMLCVTPDGEGQAELYLDTDNKGQVRFFYRFDKEKASENLRLPFQEKIAVFCSDFSYEKTLFLSVGVDLAPVSGGARIPPQWYPFEPVPLQLSIKDLSHPNSDLRVCRGMMKNAEFEIEVVDTDGDTDDGLWGGIRNVFGKSLEPFIASARTHRGVEFLNGKELRLLPTGTTGYLAVGKKGIPTLLFTRSGTFNLNLTLKGVKGDSDDKNNLLPMVIPLANIPDTPFAKPLDLLSRLAPSIVSQKEYRIFHGLAEGDLIGFGYRCYPFLEDLGAHIASKSSRKLNKDTGLRLITSYLLAEALESFAETPYNEKKQFFRHINLSAPVEANGMPLNDWIDSVVYGILVHNPNLSVVFFECADTFDSSQCLVKVGGTTFSAVPGSDRMPDANQTIVDVKGRYGVLCYDSSSSDKSVTAVLPSGVRGIAHYSLDGDMLMILRSALTLSDRSEVSFVPGVKGKGIIQISSSGSKRQITGLVAASTVKIPKMQNDNTLNGKIFKVVPQKVAFSIEGNSKIDENFLSMTYNGKDVPLTLLSGGKVESMIPDSSSAGVQVAVLSYKDAAGLSEQRKAHFLIHGDEPASPPKPEWELRSRTGKTRKNVRKPPVKPTKTATPVKKPVETVDSGSQETTETPSETEPMQQRPSDGQQSTATPPATKTPATNNGISDAQLYGGGSQVTGSPNQGNTRPEPVNNVVPEEINVASATPLTLSEVSVCTAIKNNIALGAGERFLSGIERLYCWYRFANTSGAEAEVTTEWYYFSASKEKYVLSLRKPRLLPVGSGSAYSTISRGGGKPLPDGRYRVEVKSGGKLIDIILFSVGLD